MKNFTYLILSGLFATAACDNTPTAKDVQAAKGAQMAESVSFSDNTEQDNILKRLNAFAQPGVMGYIVRFNEMGKPILYTTVDGKPTSSGKRLTQPWSDRLNGNTAEAPSDEGTWGGSSPYICFWTSSGEYWQWSGHYLYSDKPIRLTEKPIVISIVDGDEPAMAPVPKPEPDPENGDG